MNFCDCDLGVSLFTTNAPAVMDPQLLTSYKQVSRTRVGQMKADRAQMGQMQAGQTRAEQTWVGSKQAEQMRAGPTRVEHVRATLPSALNVMNTYSLGKLVQLVTASRLILYHEGRINPMKDECHYQVKH